MNTLMFPFIKHRRCVIVVLNCHPELDSGRHDPQLITHVNVAQHGVKQIQNNKDYVVVQLLSELVGFVSCTPNIIRGYLRFPPTEALQRPDMSREYNMVEIHYKQAN